MTVIEEKVRRLPKKDCITLLRDLPTVQPPRMWQQQVRELRKAIMRAYDSGGKLRERVSNFIWTGE